MSHYFRIFLALGVLGGVPAMAAAQEANDSYFKRDKNISVKERPKPEYETDGIRSGALLVQPKVFIGAEYTNNVFAEDQDKDSDGIAVLAPSVRVKTDRNVHELVFDAGLETRQYLDNGSESHTNYGAGISGRLDVRRDAYLNAGVSYGRAHDDRSVAGVARTAEERISVDRWDAYVGGYREFGRTRAEATARYRNRDYQDGSLPDGTTLDQDFRDRNDLELEVRGDYALSPDTAIFARAIYADENYDDQTGIASRDQKDIILEVGTDFEVTESVRGQVGIGVSDVSFSDPAREDFSSLSYLGRLEWFATPLITVETGGSRRVRPSTLINASSILEDSFDMRVDYEWRRNIVYSAGADYRKGKFRDIDRKDDRLSFFLAGTYLMNRSVGVTAKLINDDFNSDGVFAQDDFNETRFMIGIELRR